MQSVFLKLFNSKKHDNYFLTKWSFFFLKKHYINKKLMLFFFKNKNSLFFIDKSKFIRHSNLFINCFFNETQTFSLTNKIFVINIFFFLKKNNKVIVFFNDYTGSLLKLCVYVGIVFFLYPSKLYKYFLWSKLISFCSSVVEH